MFTVEARAGEHRLHLNPILVFPDEPWSPPFNTPAAFGNVYVKSIRFGAVDVLNDGLRLAGPTEDRLEVVIGTNPGTLDGVVRVAPQFPASGVTLALLPDVRRRTDLYRTTQADTTGRFRFERVPPGAYKVFAWDEVDAAALHDPEFIAMYEERGLSVRIGEGVTANVEVSTASP